MGETRSRALLRPRNLCKKGLPEYCIGLEKSNRPDFGRGKTKPHLLTATCGEGAKMESSMNRKGYEVLKSDENKLYRAARREAIARRAIRRSHDLVAAIQSFAFSSSTFAGLDRLAYRAKAKGDAYMAFCRREWHNSGDCGIAEIILEWRGRWH